VLFFQFAKIILTIPPLAGLPTEQSCEAMSTTRFCRTNRMMQSCELTGAAVPIDWWLRVN